MRPLIAGNWKMNGTSASLVEIDAVVHAVTASPPQADVLICPPATLIARAAEHALGRIAIGGQDCHAEISGAFTGDVSAEMLKDAGASAVIVGHSERRRYHGETDAMVAAKAKAAWRAGLLAIVCIGESEAERQAGRAFDICTNQIAESLPQGANGANTAIAYEPVWAIGSGRTPSAADIADMHGHIRRCAVARFGAKANAIRILYGGSMNPTNAAQILGIAEVGGGLIGGASLKASNFQSIFSVAATKA
jgi:triosephosphate isomerase (TIM)